MDDQGSKPIMHVLRNLFIFKIIDISSIFSLIHHCVLRNLRSAWDLLGMPDFIFLHNFFRGMWFGCSSNPQMCDVLFQKGVDMFIMYVTFCFHFNVNIVLLIVMPGTKKLYMFHYFYFLWVKYKHNSCSY